MKHFGYRHTVIACFLSYVVQSMVINFVPLLFMQFQLEFKIGLLELSSLVMLNFLVQLMADAMSITIIKYFGYRKVILLAHLCAVFGFVSLVYLPDLLKNPLLGLIIATVFYSFGGGLIEVVTNPIIESIPNDNQERMMSLLHSFYSWGFVGVTIIATLYFYFLGTAHWRILTLAWCLLPLYLIYLFIFVPIPEVIDELDESNNMITLLKNKVFWLFAVMMFCAGASEMALSQWLSLYMEESIGLSKVVGDLAGPLSFAFMMGISRTFFSVGKHQMPVVVYIIYCLIALNLSIAMMVLLDIPFIALLGSAIYGGAVGILWPGTYSLASQSLKGGTMMFGLLAIVGDLGCAVGPTLIGNVATLANGNLRIGFISTFLFPLAFLMMLWLAFRKQLIKV